ncbi:MAG: hypothetical protein ACXVHD_29580, partial [Solirubrobacteraceae bacterium]
QRLLLGQLQLEVIAQELGEAMLDLLGVGLRSGEPKQDVIRLCRVSSYAERLSRSPVVAGFGG